MVVKIQGMEGYATGVEPRKRQRVSQSASTLRRRLVEEKEEKQQLQRKVWALQAAAKRSGKKVDKPLVASSSTVYVPNSSRASNISADASTCLPSDVDTMYVPDSSVDDVSSISRPLLDALNLTPASPPPSAGVNRASTPALPNTLPTTPQTGDANIDRSLTLSPILHTTLAFPAVMTPVTTTVAPVAVTTPVTTTVAPVTTDLAAVDVGAVTTPVTTTVAPVTTDLAAVDVTAVTTPVTTTVAPVTTDLAAVDVAAVTTPVTTTVAPVTTDLAAVDVAAVTTPKVPNVTPAKTVRDIMTSDGLSPSQAPGTSRVVSKYLTLCREITSGGKVKEIVGSLQGDHIRKNRLASDFSKDLRVDRRLFSPRKLTVKKQPKTDRKQRQVTEFLRRPENSVCLPGKKDVVTCKGIRYQKYILTEYLHTLHQKYQVDNPDRKISLSCFRKLRPRYMKTVKHLNRQVCLCQKHQNFALLMKAVGFRGTPDTFIQHHDLMDKVEGGCPLEVTVEQWQNQEIQRKDKLVKKMVLEPLKLSKADFLAKFSAAVEPMRSHITRVVTQYGAVRQLKENLPAGHICAQMDFAENWAIKYNREITGAYFSKDQVTVHPIVVHYREDGQLHCKSYVVVSSETSHAAGSVYAIMKAFLPVVQEDLPAVSAVHYITDSPTSQYRNSSMITVVSKHHSLFGLGASWTYFESGHGKGPCDGVGAASKRSADGAVKMRVNIKSAAEYYDWARSSQTKLSYIFVSEDDVVHATTELRKLTADAKKVVGVMALHAVIPGSEGSVCIRDTSCFGNCCFLEGKHYPTCPGWKSVEIFPPAAVITPSQAVILPPPAPVVAPDCTPGPVSDNLGTSLDKPELVVSDFVAARYDGQWYLAKVLAVSQDTVKVDFLWPGRSNTFYWPEDKDILDIPHTDIIMKVSDVKLSAGKFKLTPATRKNIMTAFQQQ